MRDLPAYSYGIDGRRAELYRRGTFRCSIKNGCARMKVTTTPIQGLFIIEPRVFFDDRGYFFESFNAKMFRDETGHEIPFVQDNQARSVKSVLRGLHYQNNPTPQTKLIRVLEGTIWDVVV